MRRQSKTLLVARAALALLFVGAVSSCATNSPTPGDAMIHQAASTDALGDQWNKGSKIATQARHDKRDAEESISKAQSSLTDSQRALEDANRRVALGESTMADAEAEYSRRFPGKTLSGASAN